LPGLPDEGAVRHALEAAPRLQIARESIALGSAQQRRYDAGPHEWELGFLTQERTDPAGLHYREQEYGLQHGIRWPWKHQLDRRLGVQARDIGELSYADAWHEAGRALLTLWFEWRLADRRIQILDEHLTLLRSQHSTVERRIAAGDAAALELQLTAAETLRLQADRSDAMRRQQLSRVALLQEFPDFTLHTAAVPEIPPTVPDADWIQRIIADNHEIQLAEAHAEAARIAAERARSERLSDPSLRVQYSGNLDGNRKVIGLQFTLPLGGARRSAEAAIAGSEARKAASTALAAKISVAGAARAAISDAQLRYQSWQDLENASQQLAASATSVARGYSLGEFDITAMQNATRQALAARQSAGEAQLLALYAHARLLLDSHMLWALPHDDGDHE
jgi:outer membrane protein TolC